MNGGLKMRRGRIGALTITMGVLFGLVAIRLGFLVLIDGPWLVAKARKEHQGEITLAAVRGSIVDRNGKELALSAKTQSLYAQPAPLIEHSTAAQRARLAAMIGLDADSLEHRLQTKSSFVRLQRNQSDQAARAVDTLGLTGLSHVPEYYRFYPGSGLAAAVVGKAGADGQGLSGVELEYDQLVRGEAAEVHFEHDALGHPILDRPVELQDPRPGDRLQVTIDAAIQTQAENYLADQVKTSGAHAGTAIVLDPFTGEVLAMANATNAATAAADAARLHNSGVQDAFEPGSTLKGLVGAIALDNHVIDTQKQVYVENGQWHFAGKVIHDDTPRAWLNLGSIIEISSNIGAGKIALSLGAKRLDAGLEAFGIGHKTGIDLPGEGNGLLRPASSWLPIELADHGFGQGLAVTPIQLATAYAAIANGGVVMRPYVLQAAYDADGREILRHTPQVLRRAITPETAHTMNVLLRGVVNGHEGTGRLAQVADFTVAGKTGTAQMVNPANGRYYQSRLVSSFVGFVPAGDPRLVILVVLYDVSHGHFGGLFAAPVFSAIASSALQHLEVQPERPAVETASILPFGGGSSAPAIDTYEASSQSMPVDAPSTPISGRAFTPNFLGMSLRGSLALARAEHLNAEVQGTGYVVAQKPAPGASRKSNIILKLSQDPIIADQSKRLPEQKPTRRSAARAIAKSDSSNRRID
ncbi:MAG TPA: penicillin-binding transpeptidase domain-containing protein [Candidatus Binataceae bacterium]|nr:penicillin-binding transpeptidase domain-containing protein [Candidatus Binataceae bacterium]